MNIKENQTKQKLMGAYYTPNEIVDFMLRWVIESEGPQSILEPSAGDGQFLRRIKEINRESQITAIEIDEEEAKKIPNNLNCAVKVIVDDFYNFYEEQRFDQSFDVVLGNPPYIRYQFLSESQREFQSDILMNNGLKPNKLINSWVAFSVATLEMLNVGGKFAFVLPTDLLQVSYAKQLRMYFRDMFSELNVVTFKDLVFEGIQQDILIVMGVKKQKIEDEIKLRTVHIHKLSDLEKSIDEYEFDKYTDFDSEKWSSLNLEKKYRTYYDNVFKKHTEVFTKIADVEVGITTGNNNFFVIDWQKVEKNSLIEYVRPLLGRSVETFGIRYTVDDLEANSQQGKNSWLVDFNSKQLNKGALEYVQQAEKNGENTGYKLRIRNKWYEVPSIWEPDAFILRRIGQFPKLIENQANAVSTDTFHRLRLLEGTYTMDELMFLFYSSPTLLSIELEGRSFGGGALELLPGDFHNIRLPKIGKINNIKYLVEQLDSKIRDNQPFDEIVKWVDNSIQENSDSVIDFDLTFSAWKEINSARYKK